MVIKVIGMGCENCDKLYENVMEVGDLMEIVKLGVMAAPSLMIDGKLVIAGRTAKTSEIVRLLKK